MTATQARNHAHPAENSPQLAILVVDDEPLIRWSLGEALKARGHDVWTAATGAETVRVVSAEPDRFDVVVLDCRLPDRQDLSLLEDVQNLSPKTAVVMMTAFADENMRGEALARGVKAVVGKPFQLKSFVSLIESAVAS